MLLALDTSTPAPALALAEGGVVLASVRAPMDGRLEDGLVPAIEALLERARRAKREIRTLAVGLGPGGYTSLRVGIATAKGLAVGLSASLVGLGTLRILARGAAPSGGTVVVLTDARRGEVYGAAYRIDATTSSELVTPVHGSADAIVAHLRAALGESPFIAVGDAFTVLPDLGAKLGPRASVAEPDAFLPTPEALVREAWAAIDRGDVATLEGLEPHYVKPSDAKLPVRPLRTRLDDV